MNENDVGSCGGTVPVTVAHVERVQPDAPVASFTPGPWRAQKAGWGVTYIDARGQAQVAKVDEPNATANAHLIAASPELYAAARAVLANRGCADPDCCELAFAHAAALELLATALAKAEGLTR